MAFLWGFLTFFICHTIANVFLNNLYCYLIEEKCADSNSRALKNYLAYTAISVGIYVAIFIVAMLVKPFAESRVAVLIGNGIGFITGYIHFNLVAEKNYEKQKKKYDWQEMPYEEKLKYVSSVIEAFTKNKGMQSNNDRNAGSGRSSSSGVKRVVDEKTFLDSQHIFLGFTVDSTYDADNVREIKAKFLNGESLSASDASKLIFPRIFGCFGYEIDLNEALEETLRLYRKVMEQKPQENFVRENRSFMLWLHEYAVPQILLGTIYTYKGEYVKAAYHFMKGLKTEQIAINMPYCDFIRFSLNKLSYIVKEDASFDGCGFSEDEPMGSCYGNVLEADTALQVISEMEGKNDEVIVARLGSTGMFGYLQRLGSTFSVTYAHPIDIYETYVIDAEYNVKKLRLYFNGYFNPYDSEIKVATGFKIKSHSLLLNTAKFIEE